MLNIPEKLDSFDKVINTSFCIFEKRDFLNKDQYIKLKKTFPNISYFTRILSMIVFICKYLLLEG